MTRVKPKGPGRQPRFARRKAFPCFDPRRGGSLWADHMKSNVVQGATAAMAAAMLVTGCASMSGAGEEGFQPLFDGKTLNGWHFVGKPGEEYKIRDGNIVCEKGVHGNLFTEREFGNFVLRFDFKPDYAANNGVGIRAPYEGDAAYLGMEIQILEETGALAGKWGKLRPEQLHGSVYDVLAAKTGAMNPPGQWNSEEIIADGSHIKTTLNGKVILDADLHSVTSEAVLQHHPGLFSDKGHIGFLGHDDHVEFKNIRVKELAPRAEVLNQAPAGFENLFNGQDLTGWRGLLAEPLDNPFKARTLSPERRAAEQAKADDRMRKNWKVEDGTLVYRGPAYDNLVTAKDYKNFELYCDFRLEPKADSGLYLRSTPQVQIWEANSPNNPKKETSGGLYNNKKPPTGPLVNADKPVGQWNRFHVIMAGDRVHVYVNDVLVVNNIALDNYWDPQKPLLEQGPLELQAHNSGVHFRNLYMREIK
jgi:Domain of Unknown Function (DUF1080)